jgi:hypothetical protein
LLSEKQFFLFERECQIALSSAIFRLTKRKHEEPPFLTSESGKASSATA